MSSRDAWSKWRYACRMVCEISQEVGRWQRDQIAVGEEAITDWLLWKVTDKLPFAHYYKFTRWEEGRESGADWEWWFLTRQLCLGLRVQAKRLRPGTDHYPGIVHGKGSKLQIDRLLESAETSNLLPFYCFYYPYPSHAGVECPAAASGAASSPPSTLLIAPAEVIRADFIGSGHPRKGHVDADPLVIRSHPLACLFCCPTPRPGNVVQGLYDFLRLHDRIPREPRSGPVASGAANAEEGELGRGLHRRLPADRAWLLHRQKGDPLESEKGLPPPAEHILLLDFDGDEEVPSSEDDERPWESPCSELATESPEPVLRLYSLGRQDRTFAVRALATARSVPEETLREILELGDDWRKRSKVYEGLPAKVGDPERCLLLLDRLRGQARNGNDLFFLEETVRGVGRSHPGHEKAAADLLSCFYDHIRPPPPEQLFRWVETPADGRVDLWREIPAGEFLMGSLPSEEGSLDWERPRHKVVVKSAFRLAAVPVTIAQFAAFDPEHVPYHRGKVPFEDLLHHPVERVTWFQAVSFCRWLSSAFPWARGARLPQEEEWEYACRAETQTLYWSGDQEADLARVAWYGANSGDRTHRVGEKPANPWGLYDMHGNVWEWTLSEWSNDYSGRARGIKINPATVDSADLAATSGENRVIRGGGFWGGALRARAASRGWSDPGFVSVYLGFRVVLPAARSVDS